jgi:siroheme synthase
MAAAARRRTIRALPRTPRHDLDDGTRVSQRVGGGPLADTAAKACAANLRGPTIVIVGTVVSLREKLNWYAPERATQRRRDLPPTEGAQ